MVDSVKNMYVAINIFGSLSCKFCKTDTENNVLKSINAISRETASFELWKSSPIVVSVNSASFEPNGDIKNETNFPLAGYDGKQSPFLSFIRASTM